MNRLPAEMVEEGTKLAQGQRFLDVPLVDLTREEAIAVAAIGWDAYRRQLASSTSALRLLADARKPTG